LRKQPLSIPATFQHARESLAQLQDVPELEITEDFLDALHIEGEEATAEIASLETQLGELKRQLDGLWEGKNQVEYELVAVYMHRGE
jgi:ubiquitin carboxyl-terminal hydrolase 25/28